MTTLFYETVIENKGNYFTISSANGEGWESESDLINEMNMNCERLIELDDSTDYDGLEIDDIRGNIHNEPNRVFCSISGDNKTYVGIVER